VEKTTKLNYDIELIAQAIYSVNRHVKTATDKRELYDLKSKALTKLIKIGHAQKIWLEYSTQSKNAKQNTVVLVKVGIKTKGKPHYFHMLPEKEDFLSLKHKQIVGVQELLRNPKSSLSLKMAKEILVKFIDVAPVKAKIQRPIKKALDKKIFVSSFLDGNSRRYQ
jgi:hypothetical protein